jgi:hypothetical protein
MKTKLIGAALALGLAATPLASFAGGVGGGNANSNWTIYGWQNYSYNFVDNDVREFDRIDANAANIGFAASIDTGVSVAGQAVKANFQCEQFTFHQEFTGTGLCNRNSKLGLSGVWGEIMVGQWLLPYNEMVAQWVDPFYDAGLDSHSSIMGSVGYGTLFYNGGFGFTEATAVGFNRRQEGIVQWFSPNWNGFTARLAVTEGRDNESIGGRGGSGTAELDPRIWSTGVAYTMDIGQNNLWLAATYENHDEWSAFELDADDSDDDSWRLAGRWIQSFGNGMSLTLSAMYEELNLEINNIGPGVTGNALFAPGSTIDLERNAWMVSGKLDFVGPLDLRFSYMSADEYDCDAGACGGLATDDDTDADAYNIGLFYTMPAGTELRLTYSVVDNEDNANYDYGINGSGVAVGNEAEAISIGMVQWF